MSNSKKIPVSILVLMAISFVAPLVLFTPQKFAIYLEKGNIIWLGLLTAAIFGSAMYLLCKKIYPGSKLKFAVFAMIGSIFSILFTYL